MQAKRIFVIHSDVLIDVKVDAFLEAPTEPRTETNYHNIWGSLSVEPELVDANSHGQWVLYVLKENLTSIIPSIAVLNNETNNPYIIACGLWAASNQTPFNITIHPETSRTLQAGDKLVLTTIVEGITAGLSSIEVMLCAHVTRQ